MAPSDLNDDLPEVPASPPIRPRRVVSAPQPTRGRPADPAQAAPAADLPVDSETGEVFTRRSRMSGGMNQFDVPLDLQDTGWTYEFKTTTVMNQPVEASYSMAAHEGGWRPVEAKGKWLRMCPPGYTGRTIERDGQILMTRPKHLDTEARQEELDIANKQLTDRIQASLATPDGQPKSMPRRVEQLDVEVQSGTYRPSASGR